MAPRLLIHAEQKATWLGCIGRCICFITGGALGFSFACPDKDTAYELFPLQSQQQYVHLSKLHADKTEEDKTIEKIKDLHRFFQQQQGKLLTYAAAAALAAAPAAAAAALVGPAALASASAVSSAAVRAAAVAAAAEICFLFVLLSASAGAL